MRPSRLSGAWGIPGSQRTPPSPPGLRPPTTDLRLREAQLRGQLRALGQRQVLGLLEAALQGGQLVTGVDRARLSDLLGLPVHHAHLSFRLLLHGHCGQRTGRWATQPRPETPAPSRAPRDPHPPAHRLVRGLPGGALRRRRPGRELRPQSLAGGRPRRCAPRLLTSPVPAPATLDAHCRRLAPLSPCHPPARRPLTGTSPSVISLALSFLFSLPFFVFLKTFLFRIILDFRKSCGHIRLPFPSFLRPFLSSFLLSFLSLCRSIFMPPLYKQKYYIFYKNIFLCLHFSSALPPFLHSQLLLPSLFP